jgi:hypothetical protein
MRRGRHSCRVSQRLARFRLPVSEEVAHIDVGFQLRLFLVGQFAFVRRAIEFLNASGVGIWQVERQNAFGKRWIPGKSRNPLAIVYAVERPRQLLPRDRQVLGQNPRLPDHRHEIRVARPARQHVHVDVIRDSRAGAAPQIHPQI